MNTPRTENYEMGILVSKDTDLELYEEVFEESPKDCESQQRSSHKYSVKGSWRYF